MATQQAYITYVIVQAMAEAARTVVQAMAVAQAENSTRQEGKQNAGAKIGRPIMKQPTFNREPEEIYNKLNYFKFEVNNVSNHITCHKHKK